MPKRKPTKTTWSQRHPDKARQCSKAWKTRNPDWWRGRKIVQLLNAALRHGNVKSKVFKDADLTLDRWIELSPELKNGGYGALMNGSTLVPVLSWREFILDNPAQLKAFLAPGNFKLVHK